MLAGTASRTRVIVLGAGSPFEGVTHSALRAVDSESRVLDWILHAFAPLAPEIVFVGGYQLAEVMARIGKATYVRNENWRSTGSVGSLLLVPLSEGADHFVCYSDIVMRPSLVQRLAQCGDDVLAVAVDSTYPARYRDMPAAQVGRREKAKVDARGAVTAAGYDLVEAGGVGEFIGLMRIPPAVLPAVRKELAALPPEFAKAHLAALTERLRAAGIPVVAAEARGEWSDLNSARCLARFVLGTKGETLERLESMVRGARILPQVRFDVGAWRADPTALAKRAAERFRGRRLAVRSSAITEDGFQGANAGAYASILGVAPQPDAVRAAVEQVIRSFGDDRDDHQILVQPMVEDVAVSGVVLTRRLASGAPYYTFNYAEGSDTRAVTSGSNGVDLETVVTFRGTRRFPAGVHDALPAVLRAVEEVERLLHYDALDIEFAADWAGRPTLLQVRPLVVSGDRSADDDRAIGALLESAAGSLEALRSPAPGVVGTNPLWGSMPDWNPAEIIGVRPRALASSLYFHLITNEVWARQRAEYGYRDLRPLPLVRLFAGQPYVDVRASLNSFIPAVLPEPEAARLVDHCIAFLSANPELHDKVEFEVIPTCFDLDFERWKARLDDAIGNGGFARLAEGLRAITGAGVARISADLAAVERFAQRPIPAEGAPLERAVALLEECRRLGTLPFAHLARAAFVAMTLLNSAVRCGALSAARREEFLRSLETVSKKFRRDVSRVRAGTMPFAELVARYGHLRPGTYEITSECYSASPERYLALSAGAEPEEPERTFAWTAKERAALDARFDQEGVPLDAESFARFARSAITGREYSKFVFTRHLSAALELIAAFGESRGLSREELSHVAYPDLRAVSQGTLTGADAAAFLRERAERGAAYARLVEHVELPPLLRSASDFFSFRYPRVAPNFITSKQVTAPAVSDTRAGAALSNAIALIPQADPGYDWLFGQGIAGLVTMFGGANSHMAIRAAELGLPAAIGVGEPRFAELCRARVLHLDCSAKRISVEA